VTEASTQVLFEQTARFTVSWQISREGTVPALATASKTVSRMLTLIVLGAVSVAGGVVAWWVSKSVLPWQRSARSPGGRRPTTYPGRINAVFADEGNTVEVRQVIGIDTEPLEGQMRAHLGRQVPELTELIPLEQTQGDQLVAVVNLYKALGGGWKRKDEEWRAPK
jgi:hypothetical protein